MSHAANGKPSEGVVNALASFGVRSAIFSGRDLASNIFFMDQLSFLPFDGFLVAALYVEQRNY